MRDDLPPFKRHRLLALYNHSPDEDPKKNLVGIVATNAFGEDFKERGQSCSILRIYDDISRVNHSCRPNATVAWNSHLQRASLRAVRSIVNGEEIFIDYMCTEERSLRACKPRSDYLHRHFKFECTCGACNQPTAALKADSSARARAMKFYKEIRVKYPSTQLWERQDKTAADRLNQANEYIQILRNLGLVDNRLAFGYEMLAGVHETIWEIAGQARLETGFHCNHCPDANNGRAWHLDQALDAWEEARAIHERVYGQGHNVLDEDHEAMVNLWRKQKLP